jgi:hypothetical protein
VSVETQNEVLHSKTAIIDGVGVVGQPLEMTIADGGPA